MGFEVSSSAIAVSTPRRRPLIEVINVRCPLWRLFDYDSLRATVRISLTHRTATLLYYRPAASITVEIVAAFRVAV
jgi:hypothetical protein